MRTRLFKAVLHTVAISVLLAGLPWWGASIAKAENNEELPPTDPNTTQEQILQTREIDVTGDGKPDHVALVGTKLDSSSPYYAKLSIVVSGQGQNPVVIPLKGGYNPQIVFCDFNGDKLPEIYVAAETGGSGGLSTYYLYSLKNNVPTAIPLPTPLHVDAMFKNNYVVKLKIKETGKSYKIDLKDKKADYDQFGVYKSGKLIKPIIVDVHPYGMLAPIDIEHDGVCELKGVQRISGIANADTIAYVTSIWKWKDGKWVLKDSSINKQYRASDE
ncbi:hypothetical protein GK047_15960 [Paenibacillus sp. SYP-B3998]|uniref:VCBS repeat-containing protein n=1 Tax=Paenibacillus sp. SYP-B3998 TaxID=2678564 RepID=A0A6G4A0Z8_9BACL|nr:hypothetical protein [Paenibacillus sp. SYP-B3998]NEW07501.1 hypothetical protein [Paenibacillus sp. SYP-B3998]